MEGRHHCGHGADAGNLRRGVQVCGCGDECHGPAKGNQYGGGCGGGAPQGAVEEDQHVRRNRAGQEDGHVKGNKGVAFEVDIVRDYQTYGGNVLSDLV